MNHRQIAKALDKGLMVARERTPKKPRVSNPGDTISLVGAEMALLEHEEFWVMMMGARHELLGIYKAAQGTRDACLIHSREIFREAILAKACGIIIVHNHPSGDPTPSEEDRALTRRSAAAGRIIGIPLIDHIVVGTDGHRSERADTPESFQ
jgi:DNA repair protein RadC